MKLLWRCSFKNLKKGETETSLRGVIHMFVFSSWRKGVFEMGKSGFTFKIFYLFYNCIHDFHFAGWSFTVMRIVVNSNHALKCVSMLCWKLHPLPHPSIDNLRKVISSCLKTYKTLLSFFINNTYISDIRFAIITFSYIKRI